MPPSFEVFEGKAATDERWYWRLVGDNGEKVAQSEAYSNKSNAFRGVADVMRMFRDHDVEVREV